jgi:NDP-sugar pyrophosphorylase family protein
MKLEEMKMKELFDMSHTIAERIFDNHAYPWEVLPEIGDFIRSLGPLLPENEYRKIGKDIWIHKTAKVAPTIMMTGPMIICAGANVRHNAFLRGNVIIGEKAVVGNSCELKNALLFDEVQVPHFNYVGDSILGYKAHMGAGAV